MTPSRRNAPPLSPRQAAEHGRGSEVIQLIEQAEHGFVL